MKNNNCVIAARLATSSWSRKAPACHPEPIRQAQGKLRAKHVVEGSIVAILLAMFLTACGDSDGASANNGSATLEDVYASEDDLPGCTEKYDGAVAFVKEGSAAFKCEDGRWENKGEYYANNDAIKNCTSKREGEIAYIVDEDKSLVCQDGKWVKASDKVGEPAEGTSSSSSVILNDSEESSSSNASTSSSWNEVTESSSSIKDKGGEPAEPAEVSSSSNATSSSSWSEAIGSCSAQAPSSSSAEESSSSVTSSSSFIGCKNAEVDNCEYGEILDERDGKKYKTVKIGDQWWMAENLNFEYKVKGENYGIYVDETYGVFYNWPAAMDSAGNFSDNGEGCFRKNSCTPKYPVRGACPEGWHFPEKKEWEQLYSTVGKNVYALQAKGFESWPNATDAFGLSISPVGIFYGEKLWSSGDRVNYWTATEANIEVYMAIFSLTSFVFNNGPAPWGNYYPVRCVKD